MPNAARQIHAHLPGHTTGTAGVPPAFVTPARSAMLAPEDWSPGTQENRKALLKPFPSNDMTMWPASKAVGSVLNMGKELVEAVAECQKKGLAVPEITVLMPPFVSLAQA